jgi:hypothetical protein
MPIRNIDRNTLNEVAGGDQIFTLLLFFKNPFPHFSVSNVA